MHDVQLGDLTCTDQDEVEERDVAHHRLCQLRLDASWTLVDETRTMKSMVLARLQVYQRLETFRLHAKKTYFSFCPSCHCHETLQVCEQWMAEPSRQSTNANNKKVASGTFDARQKLTCFFKTATC